MVLALLGEWLDSVLERFSNLRDSGILLGPSHHRHHGGTCWGLSIVPCGRDDAMKLLPSSLLEEEAKREGFDEI